MYEHFEYKLAINVAELLHQTALACIGVPNNKKQGMLCNFNYPSAIFKRR